MLLLLLVEAETQAALVVSDSERSCYTLLVGAQTLALLPASFAEQLVAQICPVDGPLGAGSVRRLHGVVRLLLLLLLMMLGRLLLRRVFSVLLLVLQVPPSRLLLLLLLLRC